MEKMLVLLRVLLILTLLFSLTACSSPHPLPDYRQGEIEAKLSWCDSKSELLMFVRIEKSTEDGKVRDLSVEILSPDALQGITLTRKDGTLRVSCADMTVDAELLARWLRPAELLLVSGSIRPISEIESDGTVLQYAQIQKENENEIYELYLHSQTGYPHKIQYGSEVLQILSFREIS